jgi:hypothetical protein
MCKQNGPVRQGIFTNRFFKSVTTELRIKPVGTFLVKNLTSARGTNDLLIVKIPHGVFREQGIASEGELTATGVSLR